MDDVTARLVTAHNPVAPADGRCSASVAVAPGTTIAELVRAQAPALAAGPCVVVRNQRAVPREAWAGTVIADGDCVSVCAAAAGGDDSDPVRVVLQLAVVIGSLYVGNIWGLSTLKGAAAAAVVQVGGNLLVNTLVPPRQPDLTRDGGSDAAPQYSIQGTRNRMRPYAPMPVLIGEHRMWPDTVSKAFTEFVGGEQYLYQAFGFGLTDMELTDFRIGDTPVTDYDDFDLEVSGPDGVLRMFPGNVDTESGGALIGGADWVQRTTSPNTTQIQVDVVGPLYRVDDNGRIASLSVTIEGEYRLAGSGDPWESFLFGDAVRTRTHYWSKGYWSGGSLGAGQWIQLAYDRSLDSGKYTDDAVVGTHTVRAPKQNPTDYDVIWRWRSYVEREDERLGPQNQPPWSRDVHTTLDPAPPEKYPATVAQLILQNDSTEPLRRTLITDVVEGQYEIRMRRVTAEHTADDEISAITWSALKSFQPDDGDFDGQKRVAIRVRASGQLNGPIDRLSAIGTGRIPVRQGDGSWQTEYTSNPAWWFLHVAGGRYRDDGTLLYGGGLPDSRVDIDVIEEWADWCTSQGLACNAVFNRNQTVDDMLKVIAQCGRATISWATGKLGVIIDRPGEPQAVFGMSNIIAGSFSVSYVTEKLPSAIEARWIDPRIGWQPNTLRVDVPFSNSDAQPATVEFKGETHEDQVAASANLVAADQYYHRRRISWETDMEGLVVTRGDVVLLAHDLTNWDFSGRLIASDTTDAILSCEITFTAGEDHYLIAVQPDGTMSSHLVRNDGGTTDQVHFEDPLPADPGADAIDWRFLFGAVAEPGRRVKIIKLRPTRYDRVRLTAVDELQEYYNAADGTWNPAPLPKAPPVGRVRNLEFAEDVLDDDRVRVNIGWRVENAPLGVVRYRINSRGWQSLPATDTGVARIETQIGNVLTVQVRPLESEGQALLSNLQLSGGVEQSYTVTGVEDPPPDVSGFEIDVVSTTAYLRWDAIAPFRLEHYELRFSSKTTGAKWEEAIPLRPRISPGTTEVAVPLQVGTYLIKGVDGNAIESTNAALIVSTVGELEGLNVVEMLAQEPDFAGVKTGLYVDGGVLRLQLAEGIDAWTLLDDVKRLDYYSPGLVQQGTYDFDQTVDLGSVYTSRVRADLSVSSFDFLNTIDQWASLADVVSIAPNVSAYDVSLEIRTTEDDPNGTPTWSAWKPFVVADYTARALQFRLQVETELASLDVRVDQLTVTVDMPDRTVGEHDVVCPPAGLRVSYEQPFLATPAVGFGHQDLLESDKVEVTNADRTGFDIQYLNAGSGVQRTFDYVAKGYGRERNP